MATRHRNLLACAIVVAAASCIAVPASAEETRVDARSFDCLVEPNMTVKISAAVVGLLSEILVERGDTVKAGQPVAQMNATVEAANLELARAQAENESDVASGAVRVDYLSRKLSRAVKLNDSNYLSLASRDEANTDVDLAKLTLQQAEIRRKIAKVEARRAEEILALRTVRSPIDGVVVSRSMSPGEYYNEQAHIMTVSKIDPLNVEIFVPVAFYGKVKVGDVADVELEAPIGGVHPSRVSVVDNVFDAASGTFGVRLRLANPGNRLPAGLRCKARFTTPVN